MKKHLILSVGMPRAGSGWYYNLTQDLVVASGGINAGRIREKYGLKRFLTEVNCNLGTLHSLRLLPVLFPLLFESRYVIKLHAERRSIADVFIKLGVIKPTYIYRDPRDALLSAFEYGQRMSSQGLTNAFTPLDTIEKAIDFMDFYVQVARGWMKLPGTLVVKYEDLKNDYDQEVRRLLEYLDIDPQHTLIDEVVEKYRPDKKTQRSKGLHFVKGKIGRHASALSREQLLICEELFGDFIVEHGYSSRIAEVDS
jgi:hypothetical protein